ncbi:PepSY domain-containing protein [Pediococcus pentosaceus]|uniref:PepSY domain-containing protein n=1 Tax=Pediococcus pentosaceus TaxID=1255 RepID=UPI0018A18FD5|nr:PepSY domain-containing protein [Pediococcus pentosaceus]MBF7128218.1 PepSY domain-containing protein [Pediococcus pentosaceus]MBF7132598.1 PepSY domain-containing protein [Pediococcus pentosaceus]
MSSKSSAILGLTLTAIGTFALGSLVTYQIKEHRKVRPQSALARVRRSFEDDGPIEGAWIESKSSPLNRYGLKASVYYGGITKYENNELIQYEFIADAYTGTIIDIYRR